MKVRKWRIVILAAVQLMSWLAVSEAKAEPFFFVWTMIALVMTMLAASVRIRQGAAYDVTCNTRSCIAGMDNIKTYSMTQRHQSIDEMKKADDRKAVDLLVFLLFNFAMLMLAIR